MNSDIANIITIHSNLKEIQISIFTGKGGVGKTSTACAIAIDLANNGRKVFLISTAPTSNL